MSAQADVCMPEPELLPYCEADPEWCELRAKELAAFEKWQGRYHRRPCEPALGEKLYRANAAAGYMRFKGSRIHRQMEIRLDPKKLGANVNEQ